MGAAAVEQNTKQMAILTRKSPQRDLELKSQKHSVLRVDRA